MTDDICGSTETLSGEPCQNPPGCSLHSEGDGGPRSEVLETAEVVADCIEEGRSVTAACREAGICSSTHHRWMGKGREHDDGVYVEYVDRVTRARARGEAMLTDMVMDTATEQGDSRTLFNLLKAQYPDSFTTDAEGDKRDGDDWFSRLEDAIDGMD